MASLVALSACSSVTSRLPGISSVVTPYKIDILQGNVVTREQAAALQPGMGRDQVRDILGSPLLTSVFHADRWDYVFTIRRPGAAYQQRRVTVLFDGDTMKSFEADELPSERDFVSSIDTKSTKGAKVPTLALNDEQLKALPMPAKGSIPEPNSAPQGPARDYPPLEATP